MNLPVPIDRASLPAEVVPTAFISGAAYNLLRIAKLSVSEVKA